MFTPPKTDPRVLQALQAMAQGDASLCGVQLELSDGGALWPANSLTLLDGNLTWEQRDHNYPEPLVSQTPVTDSQTRELLGLVLQGEIWTANKPLGPPVPDATSMSILIRIPDVGQLYVRGYAPDMRQHAGYLAAHEAMRALGQLPVP